FDEPGPLLAAGGDHALVADALKALRYGPGMGRLIVDHQDPQPFPCLCRIYRSLHAARIPSAVSDAAIVARRAVRDESADQARDEGRAATDGARAKQTSHGKEGVVPRPAYLHPPLLKSRLPPADATRCAPLSRYPVHPLK